jgi:hypothetical protein
VVNGALLGAVIFIAGTVLYAVVSRCMYRLGQQLKAGRVFQPNTMLWDVRATREAASLNRAYADKADSHGTPIPQVTLPAHFEFGDPLVTQDLRLSHT